MMNKLILPIIERARNKKWKKEWENSFPIQTGVRYVTDTDIKRSVTFRPGDNRYTLMKIGNYCKKNKVIMQEQKEKPIKDILLFTLYLTDCHGDEPCFIGVPVDYDYRRDVLSLHKLKRMENGLYDILDDMVTYPIYRIESIEVCPNLDKWIMHPVDKPIIGYKAICVENGKLFAAMNTNVYEYQIGVPAWKEPRHPDMGVEECYFHFCTTMDDIYICGGRHDYLSHYHLPEELDLTHTRLFLVKAEEHCVHIAHDWWVTNHITVQREVSKKEIYEYYMSHLEAKKMVSDMLQLTDDFWLTMSMDESK